MVAVKRLLLTLSLLLGISPFVFGQITPQQIVLQTTNANGNGTVAQIFGQSFAAVQVRGGGGFAGTITFEGSVDGTGYHAILCRSITTFNEGTTATANGVYQCPIAGLAFFRARTSSGGNGTLNVLARFLEKVSYVSPGSGGGGGGITIAGTPNFLAMFNSGGDNIQDAEISVAKLDGSTSGSALFIGAGGIVTEDPGYTYDPDTNILSSDKFSGYEVRLRGPTSGTVTHKAPAIVTSYDLTWPDAQGSAGQIVENDGTGILSWVTPSGGGSGCTVPGSNTQVIFNDSGNCGADAGLAYLKATDNLLLHGGTVGTSGVGVFSIAKGTPPTTAPANSIQLFGEELAWTDSGNTDTGLGMIFRSVDGNGDPALIRHHFGTQTILGSNLENTKQTTGVVIDNRDVAGEYLCFKDSGLTAHGMTTFEDTDVTGCFQRNSQGGVNYTTLTGGTLGMTFGTVVTTEIAQGVNNKQAPIMFSATTKSGTSSTGMGAAKQLFAFYRGPTNVTPSLDGTVLSVTSNGDVQVRGILHLNSHSENGLGSSYGGSGTGRGAYIANNSVGGGSLFLNTMPNDSGGNGSGESSDMGLWTDDVHLLQVGGARRILIAAGNCDGSPPATTSNHMYMVARGGQAPTTGACGSDNTGLGIVGQDGTRLFFGAGHIGGDSVPPGSGFTAQDLTVQSEGSEAATSNTSPGTLILSTGQAHGTGSGGMEFWTTTAGSTGSTVRLPTKKWSINSVGDLIAHGTTSGTFGQNVPSAITSYEIKWPSLAPSVGTCLGYDSSSGGYELLDWVDCSGGGGGGSGGGALGYSAPSLTLTAGTRYAPPSGGGTPSTTEADSAVKSPAAATISNFQVTVSAAPGTGNTFVFTWRKSGSDQALTCTIADTATTCTDTTNSFSAAQGNLLSVKIVSTGTIIVTPMVSWLAAFGTSEVGITTFDSQTGATIALTRGAGIGGSSSSNTVTLTTDSTEADFLASGALTCGASTQGKAQVHTTPLQYCDNAGTPTLRYAAYGSSTGVATTATALAANGSNCSAGQFPLGVDASGAAETCTALPTTIAGTTNKITASGSTGAITLNTGSLVVHTDQANTWSTGAQDMSAATSFKVPVAAGAAPTANGDIRYDSTRKSYAAGSGSNGAVGHFPRLLSSQVSNTDSLVAATITTTETAFATLYNVPANLLASKTLALEIGGKATTSAGSPNVTIRVRWGGISGTVLYTSNTTSISSQTTVGWGMNIRISNGGATSSTASLYTHNIAAAPTGSGAAPPTNNKTDQPVTADTTGAVDLVVTLQFSANTAGNTWWLQQFNLIEW